MLSSTGLSTIINIPEDYTTIQAGRNVSTNGDTILVQPGTYMEKYDINKIIRKER